MDCHGGGILIPHHGFEWTIPLLRIASVSTVNHLYHWSELMFCETLSSYGVGLFGLSSFIHSTE